MHALAWLALLGAMIPASAVPAPAAQALLPADRPVASAVQLAPLTSQVVFETLEAGRIRELTLARPSAPPNAVRLRVFWDGADQPSIDAPLGDFFGIVAGAPGYQSLLGQVGAEDCSFRLPMAFERGARLELVNDSEAPVDLTFGLTWDRLSAPPAGGRLHVTWRRQFHETPARADLLNVGDSAGQVAGLRLSAVLNDAVEALPGRLVATLDDQDQGAVAASWREVFAASGETVQPRAALLRNDISPEDYRRLDGYRLFDQPLRFEHSCLLSLELPAPDPNVPGQVDLTSTVYWYGPSGDASRSLSLDIARRLRGFIGTALPMPPTPQELYRRLLPDRRQVLSFSSPDDWQRVTLRAAGGRTPRWIDQARGGAGNPHPGRQGIGVLSPPETGYSARLYWKVAVPHGARLLRYSLSADPHRSPEQAQIRFIFSVCSGEAVTQLRTTTLSGRGGPSAAGWLDSASPIGQAGDAVLVILEISGPGTQPELFIDRLSVE